MRIGIFGKRLSGKSLFMKRLQFVYNFTEIDSLYVKFKPSINYIFEGHSVEELKIAKQNNFIIIFVEKDENKLNEIYSLHPEQNFEEENSNIMKFSKYFDFVYKLDEYANMEEEINALKKFLTYNIKSSNFCEIEYLSRKTGKKTSRFVYITPHSLSQFSKRCRILMKLYKNQKDIFLSPEFINKLAGYEKILESKNNHYKELMKDIVKNSFKIPKENVKGSKYEKRKKRHNSNCEYFSDDIFTFIISDNTIITSEISIDNLRDVNFLTSEISKIKNKLKVISKPTYRGYNTKNAFL